MRIRKSPQEKKGLSLKKDRRNVYGENAKASRKNIPAGKQRSHKAQRRIPNEPLLDLKGEVREEEALAAEAEVANRTLIRRRASFKKQPDAPLGVVLERKKLRIRTSAKAAGSFKPK